VKRPGGVAARCVHLAREHVDRGRLGHGRCVFRLRLRLRLRSIVVFVIIGRGGVRRDRVARSVHFSRVSLEQVLVPKRAPARGLLAHEVAPAQVRHVAVRRQGLFLRELSDEAPERWAAHGRI
jgi:hypothetical protein